MLVIKFYSNGLVLKEWVLNGDESLEKAIIEMLDIDIEFFNKIRGFKNE